MCGCSSVLLCSDAGAIILLSFMAIPSMITISSLYDQYGCSTFCTSAFVYGQPYNTYSESIPTWSSSGAANLISSDVMQSGISMLILLC